MSDIITVAVITGCTGILAPISLAFVNHFLSQHSARKDERERKRKEARENASRNAVRAQSAAIEAVERHLQEVTEDRNWWRSRAIYYEKICFGGSNRGATQR